MEETSYRKKVQGVVAPVKPGHYVMVDQKTGELFVTDLGHPDYVAYKLVREKEKKAKKAESEKKKVLRQAKIEANKFAKIKSLEVKAEAALKKVADLKKALSV